MLIASNVKKSRIKPIDPGSYPARLVQIIDVGMQKRPSKGGENNDDRDKEKREVILNFELPTERIEIRNEDGTSREAPRSMRARFTLSLDSKANLRKFIDGWRGVAMSDEEASYLDLKELIGKVGLLNVIHDTSTTGNTYAKIASISRLPKAFSDLPAAEMQQYTFDLDTVDDLARMEELKMPDWLQDIIKQSSTYKELLKAKEDRDFQNINADQLPF